MDDNQEYTSVTQLLDRICEVGQGEDKVSLGVILDAVGRRSFGPLLLLAGLITLAPLIGDIPGVPTIMAIIVFLIAVQLLIHRKHFWLPKWLLSRQVERKKLRKTVGWLQKPGRFIDKFLRARLTVLAEGPAVHVIALACICIAAVMPLMEFVPFSANLAGAALSAFGFSLIARDGLVSLIAFVITASGVGVVVAQLV